MKSVLVALAAFAAAALAANEDCQALYIVEACLEGEERKLADCRDGDWDCKCNQHINILTCFNNCPQDTRINQWTGQKQIFCGYASQYPSSTTKVVAAKPTGATTPAQTTEGKADDASPTNTDATGTGTTTGTAAAATKTDSGAADLVFNAGSMLAAVAGVAAFVL
ncbi:hypothetical protein QBC37DRAFT_20175 [Rhypophila decipiens]|uniref:GPI anchored serine-threonine rich protein n=1 Tax=Rhypophila decipiens TaxID=261697 RepID=A0AAN6Y4D2_9PEZI|nr:hypothetical protein QBC37DRAFT_20175 [Rhypophila decipiens]